MQNTPKSKRIKIIVISIVSLLIFAVTAFVIFNFAIGILPKKQTGSSATSNAASAQKTYDEAVKAEQMRDFKKAQSLYEKALPYYKDRSDESIMDKNIAYGIEARITTMQNQQKALERVRAEELSNPAIKYDE